MIENMTLFDIFISELESSKKNYLEEASVSNLIEEAKSLNLSSKKTFWERFKRKESVLSENYISFDTFLKIFLKYYMNVISETEKMKKAIANKIRYRYTSTTSYFVNNKIVINGYTIAKIENGFPVCYENKTDYLKIKKDIYRFAKTLNSYNMLKKAICYDVPISFDTTLSINADGMLERNYNVTIEIKFGTYALISISIVNGKVQIITHSNEASIDAYLIKNKKSLLNNIYIKKASIQEILKVFEDYEETLVCIKLDK